MIEYTIGITISDTECHAALMHHTGTRRIIDDLIHLTQDHSKTATDTLIVMKRHFPKKSKIILGIPHQHALIQTLRVDATLSDDEIFFYLQSRQSALIDTETPFVDYETLSIDQHYRHIQAVCVHAKYLNQQRRLFTNSSLPLHAIDIDSLALNRLNRALNEHEATGKIFIHQKSSLNSSDVTALERSKIKDSFHICIGLSLWNHLQ